VSRRLRPVVVLPVVALLAGLLAGCSGNDVSSSGDQGYVSVGGNSIITSIKAAERKAPGTVSGTTLDGARTALTDFRGKVVVVNVWGSWCPPCRAEAPMLAAAARDLQRQDVVFLGINSRNPEQAGPKAFERRFKVPYASIYDPDGRTLLAFRGTLPPNAIPSTVIVDPDGRVSGSVIGAITKTTLYDLVEDARGGSGA
jgi:thiol-disulfide isomerase/thioredoxin